MHLWISCCDEYLLCNQFIVALFAVLVIALFKRVVQNWSKVRGMDKTTKVISMYLMLKRTLPERQETDMSQETRMCDMALHMSLM